MSVVKIPAQPALPTESEFLSWVRDDKLELVHKSLQQAKQSGYSTPLFSRQGMQNVLFFMYREPQKRRFDYIKIHLAHYPTDSSMERVLNQEGNKFIQKGDLSKAKKIFDYYISHFPDSPYGYSGLAGVYDSLQDKISCINASQRCIEVTKQSTSLNEEQKEELIKMAEEMIKKYKQ